MVFPFCCNDFFLQMDSKFLLTAILGYLLVAVNGELSEVTHASIWDEPKRRWKAVLAAVHLPTILREYLSDFSVHVCI